MLGEWAFRTGIHHSGGVAPQLDVNTFGFIDAMIGKREKSVKVKHTEKTKRSPNGLLLVLPLTHIAILAPRT